jgi:hypothetical protein
MAETFDEQVHDVEHAIDRDVERLLHPFGTTGVTGPTAPSGPSGPVGAIGGTGPTGLTAAAPPVGHTFMVATTPAGVTFTALLPHPALEPVGTHGTDAHGFPKQPRAEPTASGGTGNQPGDQHQIHNH